MSSTIQQHKLSRIIFPNAKGCFLFCFFFFLPKIATEDQFYCQRRKEKKDEKVKSGHHSLSYSIREWGEIVNWEKDIVNLFGYDCRIRVGFGFLMDHRNYKVHIQWQSSVPNSHLHQPYRRKKEKMVTFLLGLVTTDSSHHHHKVSFGLETRRSNQLLSCGPLQTESIIPTIKISSFPSLLYTAHNRDVTILMMFQLLSLCSCPLHTILLNVMG